MACIYIVLWLYFVTLCQSVSVVPCPLDTKHPNPDLLTIQTASTLSVLERNASLASISYRVVASSQQTPFLRPWTFEIMYTNNGMTRAQSPNRLVWTQGDPPMLISQATEFIPVAWDAISRVDAVMYSGAGSVKDRAVCFRITH